MEKAEVESSGRAPGLYVPGEKEFFRLSRDHNLVTVSRTVEADTETPVTAFLKLGGGKYSFLLESAEGGERWGRYSFIGCEPLCVVRYRDGELDFPAGGDEIMREAGARAANGVNPVDLIFDIMGSIRAGDCGHELPFHGGAVGYFAYDLLPFMEKVSLREKAGLPVPEMMFTLTRTSAAFDHLRGRIILLANVPVAEARGEEDLRRLYREATTSLESMARTLAESNPRVPPGEVYYLSEDMDFHDVSSNFTREEYEEVVRRAKEYIFAGEAFQIVPSQRFSTPVHCSPFSVYRSLRAQNPSPYMFFLRYDDLYLVGSSPEPMVRQRGGRAVIRPIAGTRPRGKTPVEDLALERDLLQDEKERAEHVMLVDLARNDLGRVCRAGSVRVSRLMEVERFSHVMHLVSEVTGELRPGYGNRELLRSSFPAGTVSGAPKVRACQLIDELERDRRGPYAGAVGYISYHGDMDTCIAIRTIVIQGKTAHVQAGGGVVADSVPAREYEETRNKARALLRAIRMAEAREGVMTG
ncbi:MAG: anthranilate synthase component I [Actinobacteria bacterium]|nr:anthranilate synthase component I [Actinomycetota bacterium]